MKELAKRLARHTTKICSCTVSKIFKSMSYWLAWGLFRASSQTVSEDLLLCSYDEVGGSIVETFIVRHERHSLQLSVSIWYYYSMDAKRILALARVDYSSAQIIALYK